MRADKGRGLLRGALLAGTAALALGAAPAEAETLADALAKAYANSPRLAAQRAALRALDERETSTRAEALGEVGASASYGLETQDGGAAFGGRTRRDGDPFSLGISGSIPIYDGGQIANATSAAEQAVAGGRADLDTVEQLVLFDAVTAYEDVRRDLQLVEVARTNVRVISEQLRAAQDRFEVGEVTRTDVSQAEARLAAARSTLAAVIGQLARSRQAYLVAVGEPPEDLQPPPPLPPLPESEADALALAEATHPRLVAGRAAVREAEFRVKQAIGAGLPNVELEGSAAYGDKSVFIDGSSRGNGDFNTAAVGLRATLPLWTGGRISSGVRQAQAGVSAAQANLHQTAREIRQNVSDAWSSLAVSRMSITAAREQIRAAQIAFEGVREEALLGARTTLDVLNADQELQQARAELIRALRDEYVAGYGLLAAVGSLSVAHLGLDVERYDPDAYRQSIAESPFSYPRDETTQWSRPHRP